MVQRFWNQIKFSRCTQEILRIKRKWVGKTPETTRMMKRKTIIVNVMARVKHVSVHASNSEVDVINPVDVVHRVQTCSIISDIFSVTKRNL